MRADAQQKAAYQRLLAKHSPRLPLGWNLALAFVIGGSICALGQIFMNRFLAQGLPPEKAGALTAVIIIFLGAALTACGVYDEIVRLAGMGGSLPVSGFANAIVAPAMEFRREGWILGVGAKIFVIAGPVLAFGLLASMAVGAVYAVLHLPLPK